MTATLTREQAEAEARKGAKVRHESWGPNEWMAFIDGELVHDNGVASRQTLSAYGEPDGWSIYEPAPTPEPTLADLAARVARLEADMSQVRQILHIPNAATEEALADVAAGRVTRHETFADLMADLNGPDDDEDFRPATGKEGVVWVNNIPYVSLKAIQALVPKLTAIEEPAPDFTTSRKPEPGEAVMTDQQIIDTAIKLSFNGVAEAETVIRLTRASIRAQLAANEAGAAKAGYDCESFRLSECIAAALKAHKEGV